MKVVKKIAFVLIIIGALNWGLVGLFNYDLVASLLGTMSTISRIVYTLVGVSALVVILGKGKGCACGEKN